VKEQKRKVLAADNGGKDIPFGRAAINKKKARKGSPTPAVMDEIFGVEACAVLGGGAQKTGKELKGSAPRGTRRGEGSRQEGG